MLKRAKHSMQNQASKIWISYQGVKDAGQSDKGKSKLPLKLTFRGLLKDASNMENWLSGWTFMGKLSPPELPPTEMLPLGRGVEG